MLCGQDLKPSRTTQSEAMIRANHRGSLRAIKLSPEFLQISAICQS
jgi:hypothetical protein